MENYLKNSTLPERCYGILPSTGDVIIINRGESGYYRTDFSSDDKELNRQLADEYNEILGVSKAQAAAMLVGSMFGWDVPGADPAQYDELGALKKEPISKHRTLNEQIASAENSKAVADNTQIEMSYSEITGLFRDVEKTKAGHIFGYVTITADSFTAPYSEEQRTYVISSNNKAFQPGMGGYSIFASSLDGSDRGVRLERYLAAEKGGKDGWKIERCYMTQNELHKANTLVNNKDMDKDTER